MRDFKTTGDIQNFADLERLIRLFLENRDYSTLLVLIKATKLPLTEKERKKINSYREFAEKAVVERKKNKETELLKNLEPQNDVYTKISMLKRLILWSTNAEEIEQFHKESCDEIKHIADRGLENKALILRAEFDFMAGWALQNRDTLKALNILNNSYNKIPHGTVMAALLSYAIVICHLVLVNQSMFIANIENRENRQKYRDMLNESIISRDNEFKLLTKNSLKHIPSEHYMKNFVDKWRKKLLRQNNG